MKKVTEETQIKKAIKQYLDIDGWFNFHIAQSMGSYAGLPDRMAFKNDICLLIEVKSSKGRLSDNQKKFQSDIESLHADKIVYIVARSVEDVNDVIEKLTGERRFLF